MGTRHSLIKAAADSVRKYSDEEEQRLAKNLLELTIAVHSGAFGHITTLLELLHAFHYNLFRGVRDHAGKIRDPGWGSETLTFGPNRSVHRNNVPAELDAVLELLDAVSLGFRITEVTIAGVQRLEM